MPKIRWKRYAEVFGGAMWMYLKRDIKADEVIYNDYNMFMYNLWKCMKKDRQKIIDGFEGIKLDDKPTFNKHREVVRNLEKENREEFLSTIPNYEIASKYAYLQLHCYSGSIDGGIGIRKSRNVLLPFIKKMNNPYYISKLDKITEVTNMDCEDFLDKYDDEDTFLYLDPPYMKTEKYYSFHNFTKDKHFSLAEKIKALKSTWILSYYNYPELVELYPPDEYVWIKKIYIKYSSPTKRKLKGEELIIFKKGMKNNSDIKTETFFEE